MNLKTFYETFPTEQVCREYLAERRWHGTPVCQHCQHTEKIYRYKDGRLYKCGVCRKQFTVTMGTVMESSKIPLQTWFLAAYIIAAHKKGIASVQLAKDMGLTQKTAWFLLHRIRYGLGENMFGKDEKLTGVVEADETFVGAPEHIGKSGHRTNKIIVMGLHERGGRVKAQQIDRADIELANKVSNSVEHGSVLMTDEFSTYKMLNHLYQHETVNHSKKEYVRGVAHTNTIENFWSVMQRGIYGIYHTVSKKHMNQYCNEFAYRHNTRKVSDNERFADAMMKLEGRLSYNKLTQKLTKRIVIRRK
jgi:transposase-like protein